MQETGLSFFGGDFELENLRYNSPSVPVFERLSRLGHFLVEHKGKARYLTARTRVVSFSYEMGPNGLEPSNQAIR